MTNNTYNTKIDSMLARECALREAGLEKASAFSETLEDGYWVVEFTADELRYTCYVDAESGEVPGMSFEPIPVESYPAEGSAFGTGRAAA